MTILRIVIVGLGAVGVRLAHLLLSRKALYHRLYAFEIRIVAVCSSTRGLHHEQGVSGAEIDNLADLGLGVPGALWLRDEVGLPDVLFDCGPSDFDKQPHPTFLPYYRLMLGAGKVVITVAKSALVSHGAELMATSKSHGGWIGLSGAAGAALPALDLLQSSVTGCMITKIEACLNATSNYILDSLVRDTTLASLGDQNDILEAAVGRARSHGFAERDVSRDIGGFDSMVKLLLLANFGMSDSMKDGLASDETSTLTNRWLSSEDVQLSGLNTCNVTRETVEEWKKMSTIPRLVSTLERVKEVLPPNDIVSHPGQSGKWSAHVALKVLPPSHPFSSLHGSSKGIIISTEEFGDIFASAGGSEPDATAFSALKDFQRWLQSRM